MLLLLAWMLWLYRYPDENYHDSAEEEREGENSIHIDHLKDIVGEKQNGMLYSKENTVYKIM